MNIFKTLYIPSAELGAFAGPNWPLLRGTLVLFKGADLIYNMETYRFGKDLSRSYE